MQGWVEEYGGILYEIWKKKDKKGYQKWGIDERYMKIKGKWRYLYGGIDREGDRLDIWLGKEGDND